MATTKFAVLAGLALLVAARGVRAQADGDSAASSGSPLFVANTPNVQLLSHIPLGRSETISGIAMEQDMTAPVRVRLAHAGPAQPGRLHAHQRQGSGARQDPLPLPHRQSGAARRVRRDGRQDVQVPRPVLLRAVLPVQRRGPPMRISARSCSTSRACRTRRRSKKSGASSRPNSAVAKGTNPQCGDARAAPSRADSTTSFPYRHSDGRTLLFATTSTGTYASIYDMGKFLAGAADKGFIGRVPVPGSDGTLSRLRRGVRSDDASGQVLRRRTAGRLFRLRRDQARNAEAAHVRHDGVPGRSSPRSVADTRSRRRLTGNTS